MKNNLIIPKDYQGEFELMDNNIEVFADAMECSKMIIESLKAKTESIKKIIGEHPDKGFVGNIDCRYCGMHFEKDIWVGLYFNNILFTSCYQLTLAVKDTDGSISSRLNETNLCFKSHYFVPEDINGRWLFFNLDNYLLYSEDNVFSEEINKIVSEIKGKKS